jgi:hypothetical protein
MDRKEQAGKGDISVTILDIIYRPVLYLKTRRFEGWILSPKCCVLNKGQDDG